MAMATNLYTSYSIIATKAHNNKSVSLSLQPGTYTTSHVKFTLPIQKRTGLSISAASTTATQVEGSATSSKASRTLPFRVGHGFDLHRLEPGYPLIIGGIDVPHDRGCEAHSDGDVLLHCVVDAILGALGLPDIGQIFPDSDPKWKGAPSSVFIKEAVRLMHEAGYEIGNLDATLILQRPSLSSVCLYVVVHIISYPTPTVKMASAQKIKTPITDLFKINHPILLAGMNVAAGPALAAAVTNAGGLGVIGGVGYTPDMLKDQIAELKADLKDKSAPFGVDLLLPQVGGSARKTNKDYTKGKLDALVDIVIAEKAALFVSAVGVPPKHIVERLHAAGIVYMNMVGHPKHVRKCLDLGVDIICAQGGEGGGHTGDVATTVLIPACVAAVRGATSPLTGRPVQVLAAGGIHSGALLAAALMMGASGVWVGTRFVLSEEAGAPEAHKEAVRTAGFDDTLRTLIFTGRPLRVRKNAYIQHWETERQQEIKELTGKGILPYEADLDKVMSGEMTTPPQGLDMGAKDEEVDIDEVMDQFRPFLMGQAAAVCNEKKSAKAIIDEFVDDASAAIQNGSQLVKVSSKL